MTVTQQHGEGCGDTAPPINSEPLLLYSWVCPYVQRVALAIAHKKVTVREESVDLQNKPSWLLRYSPQGKVPSVVYLEDGSPQVLIESLVLMQWVEDYYGDQGPALMPTSAAARARARLIVSRFDSEGTANFYKIMRASNIAAATEAYKAMRAELQWLEDHMTGPFFMGDQPTLADCGVAPFLLRAPILKHYRHIDILDGFPKLQKYLETYRALPEVAATLRLPDNAPPGQTWEDAMISAYKNYGGNPVDFSSVVQEASK